jgi:hypothetical protein
MQEIWKILQIREKIMICFHVDLGPTLEDELLHKIMQAVHTDVQPVRVTNMTQVQELLQQYDPADRYALAYSLESRSPSLLCFLVREVTKFAYETPLLFPVIEYWDRGDRTTHYTIGVQ